MKKLNLFFIIVFVSLLASESFTQTATSVILPQYIQGLNGTNNNRVPFVFRAKLDGLLPNATYRFINQIVRSTDSPTTNGAGNCFFVPSSIDSPFVRTTSPDLNAGPYGSFTTDATGSYTGWFITEPTGNARFVPGSYIFMRIRLNDGAGGTTVATRLTLPDSVKVVNLYSSAAPGDTACTGIYGQSLATSKDFVFLYDNVSGSGRPIASATVENDGIDLAPVTSFAMFYRDSVENKVGYWGTIIPNVLPNGVRRIERRLFADGSLHPVVATDADGIWPSGVNTVNPAGGTTALRINVTDAPVPVELISFSAKAENGSVILNWITATETNNSGFEIQRNSGKGFAAIGFVNGNGTTTSKKEYSFIDKNVGQGSYSYRLKQIDLNGSYTFSNIVEINTDLPREFNLAQNYPNPFNPSTKINFGLAVDSKVKLTIYNLLGQVVNTLINGNYTAGNHTISFNANGLNSGIYFYKIEAAGIDGQNFVATRKMILTK